MSTVTLDTNQWAEEQFGQCELGDKRRTKRLVHYAAQAAANPDGSTPRQTEFWADCKAAHRLFHYMETLSLAGAYEIDLAANKDQPARTAKMEVRFGRATMRRSAQVSNWVKHCGIQGIEMSVVETREIAAPVGVKPARWVLWTFERVESFADAWRVLKHYERRPIIEDWHKAVKTGCRLESRQYETAKRLEAVTGLMSVLAVRLLQLKTVARREPERPAEQVVPQRWITMLQHLRKRPTKGPWTVREFFREMARLGGFLGRTRDGEPGWITIWRGFEKLHLCVRGADAFR